MNAECLPFDPFPPNAPIFFWGANYKYKTTKSIVDILLQTLVTNVSVRSNLTGKQNLQMSP